MAQIKQHVNAGVSQQQVKLPQIQQPSDKKPSMQRDNSLNWYLGWKNK